jgi:membrane protein implicated in regulation of membrane protease activity
MRILSCTLLLFLVALLAGCALGPPGPLLPGLGPGLDWIAFLLVAIVTVVLLGPKRWRPYWPGSYSRSSRAQQILRERYAKGEIAREEYLRIASDLDAREHPHGA